MIVLEIALVGQQLTQNLLCLLDVPHSIEYVGTTIDDFGTIAVIGIKPHLVVFKCFAIFALHEIGPFQGHIGLQRLHSVAHDDAIHLGIVYHLVDEATVHLHLNLLHQAAVIGDLIFVVFFLLLLGIEHYGVVHDLHRIVHLAQGVVALGDPGKQIGGIGIFRAFLETVESSAVVAFAVNVEITFDKVPIGLGVLVVIGLSLMHLIDDHVPVAVVGIYHIQEQRRNACPGTGV